MTWQFALACFKSPLMGVFDRPGGGVLLSTGAGQAFDLSPLLGEDLQPRPARRPES